MDKNDRLFSQLLYLLHQNANTAMNSIDPKNISEEEHNQIQQHLDILKMLKEKTKGNLGDELNHIQDMMLEQLEANCIKNFVNFKNDEPAR
ncbi:MAG: hypothetical protein VX344_03240 [Bacteroidota bacterium]|nr:hypothetical protein [Bacteroidota bacterium]